MVQCGNEGGNFRVQKHDKLCQPGDQGHHQESQVMLTARILYWLSHLKVDSLPAEPQGCLIPEMGEPGGLPSVGSHRVGHN